MEKKKVTVKYLLLRGYRKLPYFKTIINLNNALNMFIQTYLYNLTAHAVEVLNPKSWKTHWDKYNNELMISSDYDLIQFN